jgi:hypothetical protein
MSNADNQLDHRRDCERTPITPPRAKSAGVRSWFAAVRSAAQ